jgi:aminoglycoside 6'-N-acetyltransferase I
MDEADAVSVSAEGAPGAQAGFGVRPATLADAPAWGAMRLALWPDEGDVAAPTELAQAIDATRDAVAFLACDADGAAIGFAEATLRRDYVNGTGSSPVGFLEGWYVAPDWRGRGVGRGLVTAVERWSHERGCIELASDALLDNARSHAAHAACGFEETERVVYFRKPLASG